jgi:hypothetical protein
MRGAKAAIKSFRQAHIDKAHPCNRSKFSVAQDVDRFLANGGIIQRVETKCAPCRPGQQLGELWGNLC